MSSFGHVHPIERLRYVARGGWGGSSIVAAEAAWALADLAQHEAPALVPACRRLLDRQPGCGALWWLAAKVLSAGDPVGEARRCASALEEDSTPQMLLASLPSGARAVRHGGIGDVAGADLVVVEIEALGPGGMVADADSAGLLEAAHAAEVALWLEAGVGRVLPPRLWDSLESRVARSRRRHGRSLRTLSGHHELFELRGVERVVGPRGAKGLDVALSETDCPEPPEMLERF
jgi:hypothetical protein